MSQEMGMARMAESPVRQSRREATGSKWTTSAACWRWECLHCGKTKVFWRAYVRRGDAEVEMVPCQGSDSCRHMLCPECRVQCDWCGLWTCREHLKGDDALLCEVCRKEGH